MIQLSILKINGYGPWTLTLGSDREHALQMLQASLYKEIQKLFSEKNCLVFLNRADEFFVISNELTTENHIEIQKILEKSFDIRLSISIGFANSPLEANNNAFEGKMNQILLNKEYSIFGFINDKFESNVSIMHFDIENLTSRRKINSPYEITSIVFNLYIKMLNFFLQKNSLTFFMGGDNFMVIANDDAKNSVKEFIELMKKESNIILNCGIGNAKTGRNAVKLATKSLDTIREIRDSGKEKPDVYELSC
ncbi:MAG: GTP cyclohydrolase [Nitrosarchaeum sp.]|nr:GTP cyclohydrolase IIa [Nitrosarchaeum sp.]PHY09835.1 MAG: GTP cyclohydrolase [Nitrosarchaeum sp.]